MATCRLCSSSCADGEYRPGTLAVRTGTVICTDCYRERQRGYNRGRDPVRDKASKVKYLANHPEARRATRRKYTWKLSPDEFQAILARQGGACALCRRDLTGGETFVDHDHRCCPPTRGRSTCGDCIRGILCRKCNQGLGMFDDDPEQLIAAAMYVMKLRDTLPAFGVA